MKTGSVQNQDRSWLCRRQKALQMSDPRRRQKSLRRLRESRVSQTVTNNLEPTVWNKAAPLRALLIEHCAADAELNLAVLEKRWIHMQAANRRYTGRI